MKRTALESKWLDRVQCRSVTHRVSSKPLT